MTGLGSDKSKKSHRNDSHFEPLCADVNTHHLEKTLSKPEFSGVKTNLHFSHNATSFNINVALQKNLYRCNARKGRLVYCTGRFEVKGKVQSQT